MSELNDTLSKKENLRNPSKAKYVFLSSYSPKSKLFNKIGFLKTARLGVSEVVQIFFAKKVQIRQSWLFYDVLCCFLPFVVLGPLARRNRQD